MVHKNVVVNNIDFNRMIGMEKIVKSRINLTCSCPKFGSNVNRVKNRVELDKIINSVFGQYNLEELIKKLENTQIAYGRLNGMEEFIEHPQNRFVDVKTPKGEIKLLSPGPLFDGSLPKLSGVPEVGQHTELIRSEFS